MPQKIEGARQKLLACGKKLLLENGYGGLGVKALTAACGMAAGTFYQYFPSKEAFVIEIVEEAWRALLDAVDEAAAAQLSPRESLEAVYGQLTAFMRSYCGAFKGTVNLSGSCAAHQQGLRELYARMEKLILALRGKGELAGDIGASQAAYLLTQLLIAAGKNEELTFDELWNCMHLQA